MQLASEYKLQVNGEAGNGNIYPAWSPIVHTDATFYPKAYAYSGTWTTPALYTLNTAAYCVLTKYVMPGAGETAMGGGEFLNDPSKWASTDVRKSGAPCMHFKYAYLRGLTSYKCQWHAAANGASVLSPETIGGAGPGAFAGWSAMPTFHSCNTVWTWKGTYPAGDALGAGDEGRSDVDCIIGFLDHMC